MDACNCRVWIRCVGVPDQALEEDPMMRYERLTNCFLFGDWDVRIYRLGEGSLEFLRSGNGEDTCTPNIRRVL